MSTYLVVLDKAAPPQSLRFGLLDFISTHKSAELVLLQLPQPLPGETEAEARRVASDNVASARSLLTAMGVPVADAVVGDPLPKKAIAAEIKSHRRAYEGILLAGEAPVLLKLVHFNLARHLERKFGVPVAYLLSEPASARVAV